MRVERYIWRCVFCDYFEWHARPKPSGFQWACSKECHFAHEAGLDERLRAIPMPPEGPINNV